MKQTEQKQNNPNPWLQIWLHPKQTIAQMDEKFNFLTYLLIWFLGLHIALNFAQEVHSGNFKSLGFILGISLVRAIFYGAVVWFVYSALAYWIGKLFGGTGTWRKMRHAMAWAQVPMLGYLILYWPLGLIVFGHDLFTSVDVTLSAGKMMLNMLVLVINLVLGIWYIFIVSNAIAGAHRISGRKGFFTFLVLILVLVLAAIGLTAIA